MMDLDILRHYTTGIPEIDKQHHDLLVMANEIIANLGDYKKTLNLITSFAKATEQHFKDEEKWMAEYTYPYMAIHVSEHEMIVYRLHAMISDIRSRPSMKLDKIYVLDISRGLLNHIDNYDIQLGNYMVAKQKEQT